MCKSCSHTQCNWKHRRRQRRGQGFRSDMTRRGEMEKQLTITATTEALELYGERNGEWLRNISGRKRVIFGMTCKYIITDTPRREQMWKLYVWSLAIINFMVTSDNLGKQILIGRVSPGLLSGNLTLQQISWDGGLAHAVWGWGGGEYKGKKTSTWVSPV